MLERQMFNMTYKEARFYLDGLSAYGSILGLDTMKELLNRLNNPQDKLKFVHIAGTNGKGSTLAFISTILKCAGWKTGRYLSPVVLDEREFIQVDEEWITQEGFTSGIELIKTAISEMLEDGYTHPTRFEVETALSFLYFGEQKCDIVVLEVGLGGDEDATNVITTTILSVITPISLDHIQILGDSIEEIAFHKTGIIKPMVPVVSCEQPPEAELVIRKVCRDRKACLWTTEPLEVQYCGYKDGMQIFHYKNYENLHIAMVGRYQIQNACTAIEAAEELERQGFRVYENHIREALQITFWAGRFQVLQKEPWIIIDGAHNADGAIRLRESIDLYFTNKHIVYIMGVLRDKDYSKIIEVTHEVAEEIFTVTPDNSRALSGEELADAIRLVHSQVQPAKSIEDALAKALNAVGAEGVIVAFGSLSYLGQFINVVKGEGYDR